MVGVGVVHHSPSRHARPYLVIVDNMIEILIKTPICRWYLMTFLQFNKFISFIKNLHTPKWYQEVTFLIIGASDYRRRFSDPRTLPIIKHCLYL